MISKKKLKQISQISFMADVIKQYSSVSDRDFLDLAPDFWLPEETRIFDMLNELETKIKNEVLEILK